MSSTASRSRSLSKISVKDEARVKEEARGVGSGRGGELGGGTCNIADVDNSKKRSRNSNSKLKNIERQAHDDIERQAHDDSERQAHDYASRRRNKSVSSYPESVVKSEAEALSSSNKKQKTLNPNFSSSPLDIEEIRFVSDPPLSWFDLHIRPDQLRPDVTLATGQCFNWKMIAKETITGGSHNIWVGVLEGIPLAICQTSSSTLYAILPFKAFYTSAAISLPDHNDISKKLYDYFQVKHDLAGLYSLWSGKCTRMAEVASCVPGLRVVRQNPWECLISFLCSSNNNIKRITQMLDNLRKSYGSYLCTITLNEGVSSTASWRLSYDAPSLSTESATSATSASSLAPSSAPSSASAAVADGLKDTVVQLYSFPTVEELHRASEDDLRRMGFGYRASFITKSIEELTKKTPDPMQWLYSLRDYGLINPQLSQSDVRGYVQNQLLLFHGVGRKVADCIAVFSMDQDSVIPVDTHVWDICVRDYAPHLQGATSLTPAIYNQVGDTFRERFEEKAGWAHSVLFAAELGDIKKLLSTKTQTEMKTFSESMKKIKIEKAAAKSASAAIVLASPKKIGETKTTTKTKSANKALKVEKEFDVKAKIKSKSNSKSKPK